jgi:nucleotide-binding universal stress UspA family protein
VYKKILAPLDGSALSECSIAHIKDISTGCNATEVILLTIVEKPPIGYLGYGSRQMIDEELERENKLENETKKKAEDYLTNVAANLKKDNIEVKTVVIQIDHGVAEAILDYTDNNQVDLIVMSSHGRSGISRFAFGSVAGRVVNYSKVPVLTVVPSSCRI